MATQGRDGSDRKGCVLNSLVHVALFKAGWVGSRLGCGFPRQVGGMTDGLNHGVK